MLLDDPSGILLQTVSFAAIKHASQRRKDPESTPYINHPIGVAVILWEAGVRDLAVLQGALLHDTVEDTDTTFEELETRFGPHVTLIVKECTDDKRLDYADRKRMQIETVGKKSEGARLVKMADKIYNLRDLQRATPRGWTRSRVQEYFAWAQKVTNGTFEIPKRSGCRGINAILENILDDLYTNGEFVFEGERLPCIRKDQEAN